jgi:hypothetical protein
MTSVLSVIFGMRLQRRLYQMGESLRFRQWLSDGQVHDRREREHDDGGHLNGAETASYPLQSSIHAVRVLQLPVELLTISAVTFVVGLILYTALMWKQHSDPGGLDYRNIMICLLLVFAALVSYYELNMGMKSIEDSTIHLLFRKKKQRRKPWPKPGGGDDAVRDEKDLQVRLRALRQSRRPWIYRDNELEDGPWVRELERISQAQEILITQMGTVTDMLGKIIQQLPSQGNPETGAPEPSRQTQRATTEKGHEPEGTPGPSRHHRDEHQEEKDLISKLLRLAKAGDEKGVLSLLDDESTTIRVSVNAVGEGGRTALMEAAATGDIGFVSSLLQRHADPLKQDKEGKTAENLAKGNNHVDVANLLARKASKLSAGSKLPAKAVEDVEQATDP